MKKHRNSSLKGGNRKRNTFFRELQLLYTLGIKPPWVLRWLAG